MKFWDSSVIIPLLINEAGAMHYANILKSDKGKMVAWWGSPVECVSAFSRRVREGMLTDKDASRAIARLEQLRASWIEVEPSEAVRKMSCRLLRTHDLRSADAMQLAAAHIVAGQLGSVDFLTEDTRLRAAAEREGFESPARL